jgi:CDP-4-dehydro-6-deoxyglucose reductase
LHLTAPRSQRLHFLAGQRVTLTAGEVSGEYYVASCPCEDRHIELHIRRDNRPFARHAFSDLAREDVVRIDGPAGQFVMKLDSRRAVIFIAWEDGFAPIKSLVQHAMSLEIAESMHLYWVAGEEGKNGVGHYQDNLCRAWADALDEFSYLPLDSASGMGAVAESILARHLDLSHVDIYAAGPHDFLQALHTGALARGLSPLGWHGETM